MDYENAKITQHALKLCKSVSLQSAGPELVEAGHYTVNVQRRRRVTLTVTLTLVISSIVNSISSNTNTVTITD